MAALARGCIHIDVCRASIDQPATGLRAKKIKKKRKRSRLSKSRERERESIEVDPQVSKYASRRIVVRGVVVVNDFITSGNEFRWTDAMARNGIKRLREELLAVAGGRTLVVWFNVAFTTQQRLKLRVWWWCFVNRHVIWDGRSKFYKMEVGSRGFNVEHNCWNWKSWDILAIFVSKLWINYVVIIWLACMKEKKKKNYTLCKIVKFRNLCNLL